jgi:hypothetical protein
MEYCLQQLCGRPNYLHGKAFAASLQYICRKNAASYSSYLKRTTAALQQIRYNLFKNMFLQ